MNCKKCGRPMGKKGYCASCDPKPAAKAPRSNKLLYIIGAIVLVAILAIGAFLIFGGDDAPETSAQAAGKHHVEIELRDYGTIKLELDADAAPITVANFIQLAESGFYDGLTFHRIMEGFMMQGGDPEGTGMGGSDETIKGEFSANGVNNPLSHTRGAISMARNSYSMDSASSQFFIVQEDSAAASLDGQYACFGYVTEGMDIVDAVCAYSSTVVIDNNGTIPAEDQPVITSIRVID